jgi:general secretion pathway protein E
MVVAQRLVRKVDKESKELSGRIGIFESITIDDQIKEQIHKSATENEIKKTAFSNNKTLEIDAQEKVKAGITTEDEIKRVLQEKD